MPDCAVCGAGERSVAPHTAWTCLTWRGLEGTSFDQINVRPHFLQTSSLEKEDILHWCIYIIPMKEKLTLWIKRSKRYILHKFASLFQAKHPFWVLLRHKYASSRRDTHFLLFEESIDQNCIIKTQTFLMLLWVSGNWPCSMPHHLTWWLGGSQGIPPAEKPKTGESRGRNVHMIYLMEIP